MDNGENQDGDPEQYWDQKEKSSENVAPHILFSSMS
jgi:hypothetical protein